MYKIRRFLEANDYEITSIPDKADYILLTTCGTADSLTQKSLIQIKELMEYASELIIVGCLPDTDWYEMKAIFNGKFIRNTEMHLLDEMFGATIPFADFENMQMDAFNDEYYFEICRGCVKRCSYCAIRIAVGPVKSVPIDILLAQINSALSANPARIILGGENIGIYGLDIGTNIRELLNLINVPDNSLMMRLNNFHPKYLLEYSDIILNMVKNRKIGLLKIPVQSGSQEILDLMNREYSIEKLGYLCDEIRRIDESLVIMTDIIVGFPGETLDSLNSTIAFINKYLDIGRIFVFTKKENTVAAKLPNQLDQESKNRMLEILLDDLRGNNYKINTNDDNIYVFCQSNMKIDKRNPYFSEVKKLFM